VRDRFGCEVPDQIRELYRERAAVERDYAARLLAVAQKAVEKKNKKMVLGVVGDDPAKLWSEETLHQR
jgi:formin-binding protein 1